MMTSPTQKAYITAIMCAKLLSLEKDAGNESATAGPAGISSIGYMNPVYSKPTHFQGNARKKKKSKYIQ